MIKTSVFYRYLYIDKNINYTMKKINMNLLLNVMMGLLLLMCFVISFRLVDYQQEKIERLYRHIEIRDEIIKEMKDTTNNVIQML